ncbi:MULTISPECIES: hypothetical protein [Marinobacter]|nr:hypothetical protein [Marinobacter salarius]WOI17496.1 hypothetical protein R1T46_11850 [Marinobacter salarius]|tara:strand:- start:1894 stop:2019 length:126 start_codon:yes stop_codon:yes gene_type:complete
MKPTDVREKAVDFRLREGWKNLVSVIQNGCKDFFNELFSIK